VDSFPSLTLARNDRKKEKGKENMRSLTSEVDGWAFLFLVYIKYKLKKLKNPIYAEASVGRPPFLTFFIKRLKIKKSPKPPLSRGLKSGIIYLVNILIK